MTSTDQLRLLTVHAHPDDESSKGAGTVARYHDEGAHCVLVCCTGGEAGSILNPAMDTPEVHADLPGVRRRELANAAEIIGYDEVIWLGYRDSGMPDTPENEDPRCFARAELDEAVGRLVGIIRRERPHVIVTYPDRQEGYPHPDHLRVHDISIIAFDAAGDPDRFPDAGDPWQPLKLYYTMWSGKRIKAIHEKLLELGFESPFDERWLSRPSQDDRITTTVEISAYYGRRKEALLAHATQIDPQSPFWFAVLSATRMTLECWTTSPQPLLLARKFATTSPPRESWIRTPCRGLSWHPLLSTCVNVELCT